MKLGIKLFPKTLPNLDKIEKELDFLEVMAERGGDLGKLHNHDLPYVIHAEHFRYGANYCNPNRDEESKESLDWAIKIADLFKGSKIIVHPGVIEGSHCSLQHAIDFINRYDDERILIENMPKFSELLEHVGVDADSMYKLVSGTEKGMCLDFGHASAAAAGLGLDHIDLIKQFMTIKPQHFHMCDGDTSQLQDSHMHLGEGNMDIQAIKKLLTEDDMVTIETPIVYENQINDLKIMRQS